MRLQLLDVSVRIESMMLMLRQDEEARVRGAVADCLRVLAQRRGTAAFDAMGQQIINSIKAAFVSTSVFSARRHCCIALWASGHVHILMPHVASQARDPVVVENGDGSSSPAQQGFLGQLLQSSYKQQRPGQGELRHDTEGWRSLESSFRALQVWLRIASCACCNHCQGNTCDRHALRTICGPQTRSLEAPAKQLVACKQALIEGCGPGALPYVTAELRQLILDSMLHKNRRASVLQARQLFDGDR